MGILEQKSFPEDIIKKICMEDTGFNPFFLREQPERRRIIEVLSKEGNEERKAREKGLWQKWVEQYLAAKPDPVLRSKHTIQYVLLNETAKNITKDLNEMESTEEQRELLSRVLSVLSKPY